MYDKVKTQARVKGVVKDGFCMDVKSENLTVSHESFVFRKIDSQALLQEAFRLRFQVYCRECNFIKESDYPQGYETDALDKHSLHFGGFDLEGKMVGAVRLILPGCGKFPIEEHCPVLDVDPKVILRERCAEISRLTISKLYRRRANDNFYDRLQVEDQQFGDRGEFFMRMRRVRPMAYGLYKAMHQESKRLGITHWFALMEKSLWLLLRINGFVFKPIGPEVDFYGMVMPYIADLSDLEKNVHEKFPLLETQYIPN